MARLLAISIGALLALALPATAGATHSAGEGPKRDLTTGTGQIEVPLAFATLAIQLHVNAQSGPAGEEPHGHFFGKISGEAFGTVIDADFSGRVTCLNVKGHDTAVGGVVESSNFFLIPLGSGILAQGTDNGEGAGAAPDTVLGLINQPVFNECPDPFVAGVQLGQGNFVAHDATP